MWHQRAPLSLGGSEPAAHGLLLCPRCRSSHTRAAAGSSSGSSGGGSSRRTLLALALLLLGAGQLVEAPEAGDLLLQGANHAACRKGVQPPSAATDGPPSPSLRPRPPPAAPPVPLLLGRRGDVGEVSLLLGWPQAPSAQPCPHPPPHYHPPPPAATRLALHRCRQCPPPARPPPHPHPPTRPPTPATPQPHLVLRRCQRLLPLPGALSVAQPPPLDQELGPPGSLPLGNHAVHLCEGQAGVEGGPGGCRGGVGEGAPMCSFGGRGRATGFGSARQWHGPAV